MCILYCMAKSASLYVYVLLQLPYMGTEATLGNLALRKIH